MKQNQGRKLVVEDDAGQVSIYWRDGVNKFYYDLTLHGQPRERKSTRTSDEVTAIAFAKQRFDEAKYRVGLGLSSKTSSIVTLVKEHINYRHEEDLGYTITLEGYNAAVKVLKSYFLPWLKENDISRVDELRNKHLSNYISWRKKINAHRPRYMEVIRNGKTYQQKRPQSHFHPPSNKALNKESNAINKFLKWCLLNDHLTNELRMPRFPENNSRNNVRTPIKREKGRRKNEIPLEDIDQETEVDNWITIEEFARLFYGAKSKIAIEVAKMKDNKAKYKTQYRNRNGNNPHSYTRNVLTWMSFQCWLIVMVNTGMRPVEFRNLRWGLVKRYRFNDGEKGLQIVAAGKGQRRPVVLKEGVRKWFETLADLCFERTLDEMLDDATMREEYVFPREDYTSQLQEIALERGIERRLIQYTLRHTFINWQFLYTENPDPLKIATVVGNSPAVIDRYYRNITPFMLAETEKGERRKGIMNVLEDELAKAKTDYQGITEILERQARKNN